MDTFGPTTGNTNDTKDNLAYLKASGETGFGNALGKMVGPQYQDSATDCLLIFWYYIAGNLDGGALVPELTNTLLEKSTPLDYIYGPKDTQAMGSWKRAMIGIGRQRDPFVVRF